MEESTQTKSGAKWPRLVIRAYLVTMGVTVLITLLTFIFLVDATKCHGVERGLMIMFGTMVVLFLASVAVVGFRVWKAIPNVAERLVAVVGYGAVLLGSLIVFAFGLLVVFNC